jgi:hypothetical protein
MMIVPRQTTVRLTYGRTIADDAGLLLTTGAIAGAVLVLARRRWRRRLPVVAPPVPPIPLDECAMPPPTRRWGAVIPAALIAGCVAARLSSVRAAPYDPMPLYERASRAYAADRFPEAAEYARNALAHGAVGPLRAELECLRGESLLRAGDSATAARAFEAVAFEMDGNAYVAQALFGLVQARMATGDPAGAAAARDRLLRDFADSPWAGRAGRAVKARASAPPEPAPPAPPAPR